MRNAAGAGGYAEVVIAVPDRGIYIFTQRLRVPSLQDPAPLQFTTWLRCSAAETQLRAREAVWPG